jgi:dipeptidyl aminopeptidase/acylaminoacyl peptidase
MFNVLQARGIPSKFVMFPDENHVSIYVMSRLDFSF